MKHIEVLLRNARAANKRILISAGLIAAAIPFAAALASRDSRPAAATEGRTVAVRDSRAMHIESVPQTGPRGETVRVVRFRLYDMGILPREVRVDKGLVAIVTEDYSGGLSELIVEREVGSTKTAVGRTVRQRDDWRGKGEMRLDPGRYEVYMSEQPKNRALLIVE